MTHRYEPETVYSDVFNIGVSLHNSAGCVTNIAYTGSGYSENIGLTWNGQYQLTEVTTNGVAIERNGFDALGRRVWNWNGTETNYFVYDGVHILAEVDNTGGLRRAYTHGPSSTGSEQAGIDNWLAMTVYTGATEKTYFFLTDHQGTVHAVMNETGSIVESYKYDAWGRLLGMYDSSGSPIDNQQSQIGNRYLWQGREYSWKTGLYYLRTRWYDPITGRWLSNDPIGISGGLNQYAFCGDNPVNWTDPLGLKIKLGGTPEQQQLLLTALQGFIRGNLSVDDKGSVSRKSCPQDEAYDTMFDKLIASEAVYDIGFGKAVLTGGGAWKPGGFNEGGQIIIEQNTEGFAYNGQKGGLRGRLGLDFIPGVPQTHGTLLAHELGHAFTHVSQTKNSNLERLALTPGQISALEDAANSWQDKVMGRMGKPIPLRN